MNAVVDALVQHSRDCWHVHPDGTLQNGFHADLVFETPKALDVLRWASCAGVTLADVDMLSFGNPHIALWDAHIALAQTPSGVCIEKFCWDPRTGHVLWVWPGLFHRNAIQSNGQTPFDNHVRLITLWRQQWVVTRPLGGGFFNGVSGHLPLVNIGVQLLAREIFGVPGWGWQINITNPLLQEMTGRRGW